MSEIAAPERLRRLMMEVSPFKIGHCVKVAPTCEYVPRWYLSPERDAEIQAIFEGKPMKLTDMMHVEDSKTHAAVNRAMNQVEHALKDYGLYVTIDLDGNYGVDRIPPDYTLRKYESVCDHLRRVIHDRYARNKPLSGLHLSEEHARKLASELADLQFNQAITEAEIYSGLVAGGARFMDLPVTVTHS